MSIAHLSFHELSSGIDRLEAGLREAILLAVRVRQEREITGPRLSDLVAQQQKVAEELGEALRRVGVSVHALQGQTDAEGPFTLADACAMSDLACGSGLVARCSTIVELVQELCQVYRANSELFVCLSQGMTQFTNCLGDLFERETFYDGDGQGVGPREMSRVCFSI